LFTLGNIGRVALENIQSEQRGSVSVLRQAAGSLPALQEIPMLPDQTAVTEVLAAEQRWAEAFRTLDFAILDELMADEYTIIQPGGVTAGKAETLDSLRSERRHWQVAKSDQHEIRLYGETAVVIGRWIGKGVNHDIPFDYQARYLCVWVKRSGRWQMVADQSSEITAPAKSG
jgi:ketosteroid isomerase-like protein